MKSSSLRNQVEEVLLTIYDKYFFKHFFRLALLIPLLCRFQLLLFDLHLTGWWYMDWRLRAWP